MRRRYDVVPGIVVAKNPIKRDIWAMRFLILCGIVCMALFAGWFIDPDHVGYGIIYWPLTLALLFKLLKMLHEWYHYWHVSIPVKPEWRTQFTVDVLTTACPGEPHEMIIRTITAMAAIRYPHTSYLCDEGNDPVLKQACQKLGVIHVTRTEKINAKAGNINNALRQATGEICVILDPDHVPIPQFLDRVLPYFEDGKIGYVQCVQAYGNQDESFIARAVAEQSYHFYGPMMMCMNSYGTVQAIGANCVFRRAALDSIGGHAAGLAEDMHTAMQLQAKGWRSVYVPEILTRGLVPTTLSAYYKQQLKWARGCFELLFRTYPALYRKFTWRQKFHHLAMPLYFLFGLINFIDISVPALALVFALTPWEVNMGTFALVFLPLCGLSLLIRQFSQRWLLEKHERGLHLAGGMLRIATWWIYLIGLVYSIFNINVPYIPTPKGDEHRNAWLLSLPNILVALLCSAAIVYGLSIDWTPYSIAMALYAGMNIIILCFITVISQQKIIHVLARYVRRIYLSRMVMQAMQVFVTPFRWMHSRVAAGVNFFLIAGISLLFLSYNSIENEVVQENGFIEKDLGGFYLGVAVSDTVVPKHVGSLESYLKRPFDIVSIRHRWGNVQANLPVTFMQQVKGRGSIPLISWEPAIENPDQCMTLCHEIYAGGYDGYLKECALQFRKYRDPVFLNFFPGFDGVEGAHRNLAPEFRKAWQYVYTFFNNLGISNLTWIWSPKYSVSDEYYPGVKFVDWIGVSCLNYGVDPGDKEWCSFDQLYGPFRKNLGRFEKPVIITELNSVTGPYQNAWIKVAMTDIQKKFEEVQALVLNTERKRIQGTLAVDYADFSLAGPETADIIRLYSQELPFNRSPVNGHSFSWSAPPSFYSSGFIERAKDGFQFKVEGKPFYIRGVAYNTGHDWRDGNMPLTRRQLIRDFERIRDMGANTIRRYDDDFYDQNVLNLASEHDLKVQFGFWFDPKVDYFRDSARVKKYLKNVEETVEAYKHHPAIVAWALGNETWGLLKHSFAKPYLTKVRNEYVRFIEHLAERVHQIDPNHPVFTCMEHEIYQLPGELVSFRDGAPAIDAIGINSYYREQISGLNHTCYQFDSLRPYLVSEFGPKGYWDPTYNRIRNGSLIEDSETEKAEWYKDQWENYVEAYKGSNIGGFAYCWHDRMEGSYTWFGLTDYKGRTKPAYYALKNSWMHIPEPCLPQFSIQQSHARADETKREFHITSSVDYKDLDYEWYLFCDDYMERIYSISSLEGGRSVQVDLPPRPGNYRLYLYASDDYGNVSTASYPLEVK